MYSKILVPLDGSDLAEKALPHVIEMAKAFKSELYLVQVVSIPVLTGFPYDTGYLYNDDLREAALSDAHRYMKDILDRFPDDFQTRIHTKVLEGNVVDCLLEYGEFQGVDLIVMATHGRGGVSRWVFGSVAESMLRASKCPIFLVRGQDESIEKLSE